MILSASKASCTNLQTPIKIKQIYFSNLLSNEILFLTVNKLLEKRKKKGESSIFWVADFSLFGIHVARKKLMRLFATKYYVWSPRKYMKKKRQ